MYIKFFEASCLHMCNKCKHLKTQCNMNRSNSGMLNLAYGIPYKRQTVLEQTNTPTIRRFVCCGCYVPLWYTLFVCSILVNIALSISLLYVSIELQNKTSERSVDSTNTLSTVQCLCSGLSHQGNALICEYDLECLDTGTYGCNAGGVQMCRYCNTDGFLQCKNDHPPPAPPPVSHQPLYSPSPVTSPIAAAPPPTMHPPPPSSSPPPNVVCVCSGFYGGVRQTCKYDPSCGIGGVSLGCNAQAMPLCRYCGFGSFSEIPCD